jgi:hypothetical protein
MRSFSRSTLLLAIALSSIQCSLMGPLDGYAGGTPGGANP